MIPRASITKQDGNTGAVRPGVTGILAIIAASATGTQNQAASFSRQDLALTALGLGPLVEDAAYVLAEAQNPVLLIRPTTSTPGAYSAITKTIAGSSVPTAGADVPVDEYANVQIVIVTGGTVGTPGVTYTYTFDGGATTSGVQALGTATKIGPLQVFGPGGSSGVSFNLGGGTLVAGDTWSCSTTRPQMTAGDLTNALEALRVCRLPWEGVLIDGDASTTFASQVDTWLAGLEPTGKFRGAWLNTRHKTLPVPTGETEAAFATALGNAYASIASIRYGIGADAADLTSLVTGISQPRPTALFDAARAMSIPMGIDPAFVGTGPIGGANISDGNGNPRWHDEELFPGLDDLRFTTLRSIDGKNGVYINNSLVFSSPGSDYVYRQHIRTMNAACETAFQLLTNELSKGVGKKPADPNTGAVFILDQDATAIETVVNAGLRTALKGQVVAVQLVLSRTDDIGANSGATIHGEVQVEALAYIKRFAITAKFVRTISINV